MTAQEAAEHDESRILILGDNATVLGFRLAGLKRAYEVKDDAREKLEEHMKDETVSIIAITESLFEKLPKGLRKTAEDSIKPVVISIPDKNSRGQGEDSLKTLIKRVIGFDLIGGNNG